MESDWNNTASAAPQFPVQSVKPSSSAYPPGSRPCVVCKNVHLSCDRGRPCSRCVRIGREADCVDPPETHRGRTKLSDGPAKRKPKHSSDHQSITPQLTFANHPLLGGTFENHFSSEFGEKQIAAPCTTTNIDQLMAEGRVWYYYTKTIILGCTHELASYLGYQIHELIGLPSTVLEPPEHVEFSSKLFDHFFNTMIPHDTVEVDIACDSILMARNGRRFEALTSVHLFMKNRVVTVAMIKLLKLKRDNLSPGLPPPSPNALVKLRRASGEVVDLHQVNASFSESDPTSHTPFSPPSSSSGEHLSATYSTSPYLMAQPQQQQQQQQQQPPLQPSFSSPFTTGDVNVNAHQPSSSSSSSFAPLLPLSPSSSSSSLHSKQNGDHLFDLPAELLLFDAPNTNASLSSVALAMGEPPSSPTTTLNWK